ncbi:MAG: hypothetical protein ACLGSD_14180 [Acidobacteriota bacterium]
MAGRSLAAPGAGATILAQAQHQLDLGRATLDTNTLAGAKSGFDACLNANPRDAVCLYGRALTEHYLNQAEGWAHQKSAADKSLDAAIADAEQAVAADDRLADAHALLADLYGQKITGMFSGMHYGPKANAESARALQLDRNNAQAYAVLGRKYLYSPAMFGGDIDKAIASFNKATELDPESYEDFAWLAIACRKKGDTAAAQRALAQALHLNPRSAFAQRVQAGAE